MRRLQMEEMLATLSGSLRSVLTDVEHAQALLDPEATKTKRQREAEREIKEILRSVEGNLTDTVVGIRMVTYDRNGM